VTNTKNATGAASGRRARLARALAGPSQGWSSLVLLLVMLAATGLAIDGSRWMGAAPDGSSQTAMLPVLMIAAGLTGSLLAWSRLTLGWVDLLAAIAGAAACLLLASAAISDAPSLVERMRALDDSLATFLQDVLVTDTRTQETSAFLLTVGALAWTSGVFAAVSIFRRSHAVGAIVSIGALLVVEVLATSRPQDLWLVVFAGAALLLVLRLGLEEQRDRWRRRRIGGGQVVGSLFLRGGTVVVALMILGSMLLAQVASSSSVTAAFPQLDAFVADLAAQVQGLVGAAPPSSRSGNGVFPERRPIGTTWSLVPETLFLAEPTDLEPHYWRGAAYDRFDGHYWYRTEKSRQDIRAGDDLLASSEDRVDEDSPDHVSVEVLITSVSLDGRQLPVPQNPVTLDRDAHLDLRGDNGTFQVLEAADLVRPGGRYDVTAMVPDIGDEDGLTIYRLIAGGTQYPDWLKPFRVVSPGAAGPRTRAAADAIHDALPPGNRDPYRLAKATQDFLREDAQFHYSTSIAGLCNRDETVSECLLRTGTGFCQQYATTMVMMLRSLHVPARYVEGYLPGRPNDAGQYEVDGSAAHAWVEVWFDDVGWIPFDPTPGDPSLDENGQESTQLPLGEPPATPGPDDTPAPGATDDGATFDPEATEPPLDTPVPSESPLADGSEGGRDPDLGIWLTGLGGLTIVLLALGVAGWLWFRRFPGREPELVWRGVTSLATRLGLGPRPSQTPYEYTVTLSQVVPRVASDLRVVADAKVDATYAPRRSGARSLAQLRRAYRRSRAGLLRLLLRRRR
jgi:transglutaminase-like putative cysteine protease